MAVPALTVTLSNGADSAAFTSPAPDIPVTPTIPGVVHRAGGGSLVKYQTGPAYFEVVLSIPKLTTAQKTALDTFFRAHWRDANTYTDEGGTTFTVYFLDTTLPFVKVQKGLWTVTLHLQTSAILI